jgi:hypothetical protein
MITVSTDLPTLRTALADELDKARSVEAPPEKGGSAPY